VPDNRHSPKSGSQGRYGAVFSGVSSGSVSYSEVEPTLLSRCVQAVTNAGDAITFGRTSDGGAYYVGVLADGKVDKRYLDSGESLEDLLRSLAVAAEALVV
jgi:hypothetical protein